MNTTLPARPPSRRADQRLAVAIITAWLVVLCLGPFVIRPWGNAVSQAGDPDSFLTGVALGSDFVSFWTGATLVREGAGSGLYDMEAQQRLQETWRVERFGPEPAGLVTRLDPFHNPPPLALLFVPLTLLPISWGFLLWTLGSVACLAVAVAIPLRGAPRAQSAAALMLASGIVADTLFWGQVDGVFLLALSVGLVSLASGRPFLGGVLLGFLWLKPQYAVILPVIFLLKRRWWELAGMAASGVALAAVSVLMIGMDGVVRYVEVLTRIGGFQPPEESFIFPEIMLNWRAMVVNLWPGVPEATGSALVLGLGAATIGVSLLAWRGRWDPSSPRFGVQMLVAMLAVVLATPHSHLHGAALLFVPLALVLARPPYGTRLPASWRRMLMLGFALTWIGWLLIPVRWLLAPYFLVAMVMLLRHLLVRPGIRNHQDTKHTKTHEEGIGDSRVPLGEDQGEGHPRPDVVAGLRAGHRDGPAETPAPTPFGIGGETCVSPSYLRRLDTRWSVALGTVWVLLLIFFAVGIRVWEPRFPLTNDFVSFWTAGHLVRDGAGPGLYDMEAQSQFQVEQRLQAIGTAEMREGVTLDPFHSPPAFALPFVPLTLLPVQVAFLLWSALSLASFAAAIALPLRGHPVGRTVAVAMLSFAGVSDTLVWGQVNGLFALALGLGMLALASGRAFLGGALLGLLWLKPQYAVILPVIFLWKRRWWELGGMAASGLVLGAISVAMVGIEGIVRYLEVLRRIGGFYAPPDSFIFPQGMPNWRGFLMTLFPGIPEATGSALVLALAAATVALSLLAWRGTWDPTSARFPLQLLVVVLATIVVAPHSSLHGISLLLPPLALALARLAGQERTDRWWYLLLGAGYVLAAFAWVEKSLVWLLVPFFLLVLSIVVCVLWRTDALSRARTRKGEGFPQPVPEL